MKKWSFTVGGQPRYARWDGVLDTDSVELTEQADALIAEGVIVECGEIGYLRKASFETRVRGWGTINRAVVLVADAGSIKFPFSYFNHSCIDDEDLEKAKFATRSEAGRYAANMRWKGNVKGDDDGGRDPVVEQEIGRVRAMVSQLGTLFQHDPLSTEIDASDWSKATGTLFVDVKGAGYVPTASVMAVETEIRALGKTVYESLAKSGVVDTSEEADKRELEAMRTKQRTLELAEVALKKVLSSPALAETAQEIEVLRREFTEASRAMRQASDEYDDNKVPFGNRQTPEQREASSRAYAERKAAQKLKATLKAKILLKQRKIDEVTSNTVFITADGKSVFISGAAKHAEKTYQETAIKNSLTGLDLAQAVTKLVSLYRGTGGLVHVSTSKTKGELKDKSSESADFLRKFSEDIATHMPKDWVDDVNAKYDTNLILVKTKGGGSWGQLEREISTSGTTQVNLHEFIHAAMYANPVRQAIEHAHLSKRTFGSASAPIDGSFQSKIVKGRQRTVQGVGYPTGEFIAQGAYIKDKFVDPYSGRMYNSGGTEVVTVGYDSFSRGGWRATATLGKLDMEQVYLTLGMLMAS